MATGRRLALLSAVLGSVAALGSAQAIPPPAPVQPMLLNVRTSCHPTFDRVVLDISGPLPAHSQTWVPKLIYDASGKPVPLAGTAFASIKLAGSTAHVPDGLDAGLSVYSGPRLAMVPCTRLRGVALTGDFEGTVTVGIATSKKTPLTVSTLTNPTRLVVDVAH